MRDIILTVYDYNELDDNAKKLKIIDSFNRTYHHDFLEAQL